MYQSLVCSREFSHIAWPAFENYFPWLKFIASELFNWPIFSLDSLKFIKMWAHERHFFYSSPRLTCSVNDKVKIVEIFEFQADNGLSIQLIVTII